MTDDLCPEPAGRSFYRQKWVSRATSRLTSAPPKNDMERMFQTNSRREREPGIKERQQKLQKMVLLSDTCSKVFRCKIRCRDPVPTAEILGFPTAVGSMGFSPHGGAARTGAELGVGIRSNRRETVFHKHVFGRSPTTNKTRTKSLKTANKKNPMGAVTAITIALAAWLPTTAGEL